MTQTGQQGDKYLKMMWGQIVISASILIAILGFFITIMASISDIRSDVIEQRTISKDMMKYEYIPTKDRVIKNEADIKIIQKNINRLDSLTRLHSGQIYHAFDVMSKKFGLPPQNGYKYE